ncbi:hypothetical protein [Candidatus Binatus sp.]|uniref:hypothetical protein n=1 Tax=Candidatus Binatus sp. TaxID=2811406 RepID=UPI003C83699B
MRAVWILPLLGSLIAGFEFFNSLISATSAPQQAAGAAMAMCWAVLPYVFARAAEGLSQAQAPSPMLPATRETKG